MSATLALAILHLGQMVLMHFAGIPISAGAPVAALCLHTGASIYLGHLRSWRRLTWLGLTIGLLLTQALPFLGYVIPWGQLNYWVAVQLAGIGLAGPLELMTRWDWTALGLTMLVMVFAFDVAAMDRRVRSDGHWTVVAPVLCVVVAGHAVVHFAAAACSRGAPFTSVDEIGQAVECGFVQADLIGRSGFSAPASVVPEWHVLPFYAVLRAVPDKLGGVLAMFAVLGIPILATWFGAERLRVGRMSTWWRSACILLLATVAGLGWLGAQPAEELVLLASRALAIYVVLFPIIPFALRAMSRI